MKDEYVGHSLKKTMNKRKEKKTNEKIVKRKNNIMKNIKGGIGDEVVGREKKKREEKAKMKMRKQKYFTLYRKNAKGKKHTKRVKLM